MSDLAGAEYTIDPVTLRAQPVDAAAMERRARALQAQAAQAVETTESARSASHAAMLFTLLGQLEPAAALVEFALARQPLTSHLYDRTVTEIRHAQLHQFAARLPQAQALLQGVIARCRSEATASALLDFALQHQGKVLFDQGLYRQALGCFQEALVLRQLKKNPELMASTELAIATTTQCLDRTGTQPGRASPTSP